MLLETPIPVETRHMGPNVCRKEGVPAGNWRHALTLLLVATAASLANAERRPSLLSYSFLFVSLAVREGNRKSKEGPMLCTEAGHSRLIPFPFRFNAPCLGSWLCHESHATNLLQILPLIWIIDLKKVLCTILTVLILFKVKTVNREGFPPIYWHKLEMRLCYEVSTC